MLPFNSPEFMTQTAEIVFATGAAIAALITAMFTGRF
jgi:hypothetical protein